MELLALPRRSPQNGWNTSAEKPMSIWKMFSELKICSCRRDLERARGIHEVATNTGDDRNLRLASTLVYVYSKCGSMAEAQEVFDSMAIRDVVSWNALLFGYADAGEGEKALELFLGMQFEGFEAEDLTLVALLKACSCVAEKDEFDEGRKLLCLQKVMALHAQAAVRGFELNIFLSNTSMDAYGKCSFMPGAQRTFDATGHRTVVSWNALMFGYAANGYGQEALALFLQMGHEVTRNCLSFVAVFKAFGVLADAEEGKRLDGKLVKPATRHRGMATHAICEYASDLRIVSASISMYMKCGSTEEARKVFEMSRRRDIACWNALILGYAENGGASSALELYSRMKRESGLLPNSRTYGAALKACAALALLQTGKSIDDEVHNRGMGTDPVLVNSLVDFYAKCGCMDDAQRIFDSKNAPKNLVTWTALITGYSRAGNTRKVFQAFEEMRRQKVQPNGVTFLCVLAGCSHAGLVDEGVKFFKSMTNDYSIHVEAGHYSCMVDMLGRANRLEEAVSTLTNMPFKPTTVTWMSILSSCQKWKNVDLAKVAFEELLTLDNKDPRPYILMSTIYANAGMWEMQAEVNTMRLRARALKKEPGQSWWIGGLDDKFVAVNMA